MHLEVYNGGFGQYFDNSTGTTAPEAVEGFDAIGMPAVAGIVRSAMTRLGDPYPVEREQRMDAGDADEDGILFDDLDTAFYELVDTDRIFRRVPKFVPFADAYAERMA